jgi:hypothetical protein
MSSNELEKELLTRLLHAHPGGLGKEILDNYRDVEETRQVLAELTQRGLVQDRKPEANLNSEPYKLTAAGVEQAKRYEEDVS